MRSIFGPVLVLCLAGLVLSSCASTPDRAEPPPGYGRGSPRQTVWYLQWAFENESPRHLWQCLSDGLKQREGFTYSDLELFFSEAKSWVHDNIGDVDAIEIDDIQEIDARHLRVFFVAGEKKAIVVFALDTGWELKPAKAGVDTLSGRSDDISELMVIQDGKARITLPDVGNKYRPPDLERAVIEHVWRRDGIEDTRGVERHRTPDS
ncbi:MAG: hypothetical protein KDB53_16285 [Planctomycetes bacterium]|nr:hypothetical protein [Planctomycetota bacterium]